MKNYKNMFIYALHNPRKCVKADALSLFETLVDELDMKNSRYARAVRYHLAPRNPKDTGLLECTKHEARNSLATLLALGKDKHIVPACHIAYHITPKPETIPNQAKYWLPRFLSQRTDDATMLKYFELTKDHLRASNNNIALRMTRQGLTDRLSYTKDKTPGLYTDLSGGSHDVGKRVFPDIDRVIPNLSDRPIEQSITGSQFWEIIEYGTNSQNLPAVVCYENAALFDKYYVKLCIFTHSAVWVDIENTLLYVDNGDHQITVIGIK